MKPLFLLIPVFIISLLISLTGSVFADSANIGGTGNTVKVMDSSEVKMVEEEILIDVYDGEKIVEGYGKLLSGYVDVDVTYSFKNLTDEAITVQMGFPEDCIGFCFMEEEDWQDWNDDNAESLLYDFYKLVDFKSFVDGQEVPVTFRNSMTAETEGINWYLFEVDFAPNELKEVRNTYWISPISYRTGYWFNYILHTGASWSDDIDKVDISVTLHDDLSMYDVYDVTPDGFKYDLDNNSIIWNMTDIEPTDDDDISVSYNEVGSNFYCLFEPEDSILDASSYLPAENETIAYYPCMAADGDKNTSWVEGAEDDGEGEWVKVLLDPDKTYYQFRIFAGYGSTEQLWEQNNRVKKAELEFSNGDRMTYDFADLYDYLDFSLKKTVEGAESVKIHILETYPGTKYDDTAIAEVEFFGLLSGGEIIDNSAVFPDIVGYVYRSAVEFVYEREIVQGYPDGTYRPDNPVNRAEMTKIIIEVVYPGMAEGENCFPDVSDDWYAMYVCYAKEKGVIGGYPDGTFKPENTVNYAEALKIVLEAFGLASGEQTDTWYDAYLDVATETGVGVPYSEPWEELTRGKMAELIKRVLEYKEALQT